MIYDHLMSRIDYSGWSEYLYDLYESFGVEEKLPLELASGSGKLSRKLLSHFSKIVCSDLNLKMLKINGNKNLLKVNCDMRRLPFKREFGFIYCTFDSFNYLINREDVSLVLKQIGSLLKSEGLFTFDVSLEANSIKNIGILNRSGEYKGIKYTQTSNYNTDSRYHSNIFKLIFPDGSKKYESHTQKIYAFNEYFDIIDNLELYVSECFEFFTFKDANPDCERVQFILRKR